MATNHRRSDRQSPHEFSKNESWGVLNQLRQRDTCCSCQAASPPAGDQGISRNHAPDWPTTERGYVWPHLQGNPGRQRASETQVSITLDTCAHRVKLCRLLLVTFCAFFGHSAASRSVRKVRTSASAAALVPPPFRSMQVKNSAKGSAPKSNATSRRASASVGSRGTGKMSTRHTIEVRYELDETGWWLATVPAIPGCHTQGRTIEQAENRIREALTLFVPAATAAKATLSANVQLPSAAKRALSSALEKRAHADALAMESQAATRSATLALSEVGLSLRDIGRLLGLTRQRAHQILGD